MGDQFWSPTQELIRMPHGWKMLRRGRVHSEGAIIPEGQGVLGVYLREGDSAIRVGTAMTVQTAARMLWDAD